MAGFGHGLLKLLIVIQILKKKKQEILFSLFFTLLALAIVILAYINAKCRIVIIITSIQILILHFYSIISRV